jgi:hypothetical protein
MPAKTTEMELFAIMLNTAEETLPLLMQRYGAAWGIALYGRQTRTVLQALSSDCLGNPSTRR